MPPWFGLRGLRAVFLGQDVQSKLPNLNLEKKEHQTAILIFAAPNQSTAEVTAAPATIPSNTALKEVMRGTLPFQK